MSRTIAIIGVPWSAHELIPAKRDGRVLGAQLLVVDTAEMLRIVDSSLGIETVPVETLESDDVIHVLRRRRPDCVVSLTEMTLVRAAEIREALGLTGTSARTERWISDKAMTRRCLRQSGLTQVASWEATISEVGTLVGTLPLPVVLKPRALTGSAGVRLVRSVEDVQNMEIQYDGARAEQFSRDQLLLEEYVPGDEISAEAIAVRGEVTLLAITDKVNTGAPHYYEVGHVMPSRFAPEWTHRIRDYLQAVADALDIVTSPIHAELKIAGDQLEIIEIHSRFGGDNIVRLLEEVFQFRPFELYFASVLGLKSAFPSGYHVTWGIGFFTAAIGCPVSLRSLGIPHPASVVEIDFDLRRRPKIEEYEGVKLLFWRPGHIFFASESYSDVLENVTFVANCLSTSPADTTKGTAG